MVLENSETPDPKAVASNEIEEELDFDEMLHQCRRDIVCEDYECAAATLAKLCEGLSSQHGEKHAKLAEPLYLYGRALLEVSRLDVNVIGEGVEQQDDKTKEDATTGEEKNGKAEVEEPKMEVEDATTTTEQENNDKEVDETAEDAKDTAEEVDSNEAADKEENGAEEEQQVDEAINEEDDAELNGEECSNLQLAWENLELSRIIHASHIEELRANSAPTTNQDELREWLMRMSECVSLLSDVGLELGHNDQAVDDAYQALALKKEAISLMNNLGDETEDLEKKVLCDRDLAESHFKVGLVHASNEVYDRAMSEYEQCISLLRQCIQFLKCKEAAEDVSEAVKAVCVKHIQQIQDVLPDIESTLTDAKESAKYILKEKEQLKNLMAAALQQSTAVVGSTKDGSAVESRDADDISHLVRKKTTKVVTGEVVGKENGAAEEDLAPPSKRVKLSEDVETAVTKE